MVQKTEFVSLVDPVYSEYPSLRAVVYLGQLCIDGFVLLVVVWCRHKPFTMLAVWPLAHSTTK